MKKIGLLFAMTALALAPLSHAAAARKRTYNLADGQEFTHYAKREMAKIKVGLVYYGRYWSRKDLDRIAPLLQKRFALATSNEITLEVVYTDVLDYRNKIENFPNYSPQGAATEITDKSRRQRLWYYDHVGGKILGEAYDEFKKTPLGKENYPKVDALLVVSGAQFDALGLAHGRVAVTEQPREIAWGLKSGGRTEFVSDEGVVDELVHELGHIMFLGHASTQCMKRDLTLEERQACCEASPSGKDVMSYCRSRKDVDENFFHRFESCNLKMIQDLIRPAMLNGANRKVRGRTRCE